MRYAIAFTSVAALIASTSITSNAHAAPPDQAAAVPKAGEASGQEPRLLAGRRFALVIGVETVAVPGIEANPLPGCTRDANALAARLVQSGYAVMRLSEASNDPAPTSANAHAALREMAANAGPTDLVLVYISTHGGVMEGRPMLLLKDAPIFLDDIKEELSRSKALVRLIFLDACRDMPGFPTQTREYRDIHTVLSCRPDEYSLATADGLSVFTEVLIEGLNGCKADRVKDGRIELDELLYYLDERVPVLAERVNPGHKQRPTRTVVDPRAVNPVIATCSILDQLTLQAPEPNALGLIGVEGPVARGPNNDLIMPGDLGELVRVGMTREQIASALAIDPAKIDRPTPSGRDIVVIDDRPFVGDTFYVTFNDAKLTNWFITMRNPCVSGYSASASRAMFLKLVDGDLTADVETRLKGASRGELLARLGCPSQIFANSVNSAVELYTYEDVPVEGVRLTAIMRRDVVEGVKVEEAKR